MEARQVRHLSFMSTWIFVFFFLAACSGMASPKLHLERTVFVAFAGEGLNLDCELNLPVNESSGVLTCSDPLHKPIYSCPIAESHGQPQTLLLILELVNMTASGEYSCRYKTAAVYWYLRVRKVITAAGLICLLLVFSVVSSVYVFRGHGTDCHTKCGRKGNQKREERKKGETVDNNVDVITSPTTSFYASLEARPRSIYDVLDHSTVNREPDRSKAKQKKKEPGEPVVQTAKDQHEGVFDSVYENF
ncbi:uncharacterized protein LOC130190799 isoform X2 [Pseudoliparis swirei]|uniref:uncharacterized protein LOC130190799 isoform X2 n=1 Tax=Pseudoliparis swirei TaxID=2059687 RepID=UPI0024BE4913|nr:uncharacterized protein LOC130190799 isoform X2 [Pseudoliparis swirei]